jgi:urea transport system ATP-binding protein
MLEVTNLNVSIGGSRILRDVGFSVPANQVVCLMGRNGVGKTTTLKSILGLRKITSGSIALNGVEISGWNPDARVRAGIGYVPQGREIFPSLTVLENLQVSQAAVGRKAPDRFEHVFTLFPMLKDMLHRKGGVLSGGQQQQLAIGRALLTEPKLLILDEPTEGIQPSIIDQIGDAILALKGELSVLLVEQYLDFAKELGDRFVIMDRGSVVARGEIGELHEGMVKQYLTV